MEGEEPQRTNEIPPVRRDPEPTVVGRARNVDGEAAPLERSFGRYRILGKLGEGGMSVVWEAEHPQRGRREALKVLRPDLGDDPHLAERFHREVRAMAGLRHDHVVEVYDSGEVDGELYYTMPLLRGPTLLGLLEQIRATGERPSGVKANEILDRYDIPPSPVVGEKPEIAYARRVAGSLVGVADALGAMHGRSILHRDVKPSNLMLDERGRVVIADFGLVRTEDQRITAADEWIGTPAYMSPEQILPKDDVVDGRSDIYALGATLYEMLTLGLPHRGETVAETLALILEKRAQGVHQANPGLPRDIATIVARCLEKRPQDRYADATRLAGDLAAFARGAGIATKPVGRTKRALHAGARHWRPLAAVGAVVLAAVLWYLSRPAHLSVKTVPPGMLHVNGEEVGPTPVVLHPVSPGTHEIRVVTNHTGFLPLERTIPIARGEAKDIECFLRARDPADPEVVSLLIAAAGWERSEADVAITRSPEDRPPVITVWPRGLVEEAPRRVVLCVCENVPQVHVELRQAGEDEARRLAAWEIEPTRRESVLEIPHDVRAHIRPGVAYQVEATVDGTDSPQVTEFAVLEPSEATRIQEEIARIDQAFDADDPASAFVRAEFQLSEGLYVAAYREVEALREQVGPRREVARLALAVLEQAGLSDLGPWSDWARTWLGADR